MSLWDVNGQPLASITTAWGPEGTITCCCIVEGPVWDASHVIVTGSKDGMVRVSVFGGAECVHRRITRLSHFFTAPMGQALHIKFESIPY